MTTIQSLDPQEVKEMLKNPNLTVIDVRTEEEFEEGALPRAQLVPLQDLANRINDMPQNKNTPILLYCSHGVRSLRAADYLQSLGYKQLFSIKGGLALFWGEG